MEQPREWVTYEYRIRYLPNLRCRVWRPWSKATSELDALRAVAVLNRRFPKCRFRAVRIRHTEEVIG